MLWPELSDERATVALLLEIDPIGMLRDSKARPGKPVFDQYLNDRPYAGASFLTVALARVFGAAMHGECDDRPELVGKPLPLEMRFPALAAPGGELEIRQLFEPLGYQVSIQCLSTADTATGEPATYFDTTIQQIVTLDQLLRHCYVLLPVLDQQKHYYIAEPEIDKLLAKGNGWLRDHPHHDLIIRRYLKNQPEYTEVAYRELFGHAGEEPDSEPRIERDEYETVGEAALGLNRLRHRSVIAALAGRSIRRLVDMGCGEGQFLQALVSETDIPQLIGVDVSPKILNVARRRLDRVRMTEQRVTLYQGSLGYRDNRLRGVDALVLMETIEHLDPTRLALAEAVLFGDVAPEILVVTTPNRDYNQLWPHLPAGDRRHWDHRFEWTRDEFASWATELASRYKYTVDLSPIGPVDPEWGAPTQMALFERTHA